MYVSLPSLFSCAHIFISVLLLFLPFSECQSAQMPEGTGLSGRKWKAYDIFLTKNAQKILKSPKTLFLKKDTGLAFPIEKDPSTHLLFIHLKGTPNGYIGRGRHKIVTKSILYDSMHPHVVARCESDKTAAKEVKILQNLKGIRGVAQLIAAIPRSHRKIDIFLEYYQTGSLAQVQGGSLHIEEYEYLPVMYDVMIGLQSIHDRGYMHRDLHRGNILLHRSSNGIRAAITDFGQAFKINSHRNERVSIPNSGCPPEILLRDFRHIDRKKSETYALGVSFYVMLYGNKPSWTELFNQYDIPHYSMRKRKKIHAAISKLHAKEQQEVERTPNSLRRDVALLVFQLLDPQPKERISLTKAIQRVQELGLTWGQPVS